MTEVKLWEYSTVTLGANENTPLLDMKSFKSEELEAYLRKMDVSDSKGKYIEHIIALIKALGEPSSDTIEKLIQQPRHSTEVMEALDEFQKQWTQK